MWKSKIKLCIKSNLKKLPFLQKRSIKKNFSKYINYSDKKVRYVLKGREKIKQYANLLEKIEIKICPKRKLQHWIDENLLMYHEKGVLGNMPPKYSVIIDNSLEELIIEYSKKNDSISQKNVLLLNQMKKYCLRVVSEINKHEKSDELTRTAEIFTNMLDKKAQTLDEALQRILLWSSLFWQSGHKLIGLGRLDVILSRFEMQDKEEQRELLNEFLALLHEHYEFKSSAILGDIGQIIVLGGIDEDNHYFSNSFTYMFIEEIMKLRIPDPKVLLRVSKDMPQNLLDLAIESIAEGIGSPLISNDDVLVEQLIRYGYSREDACNYVTSACWEPQIYGKSLGQNNVGTINFAEVMSDLLKNQEICQITTFNELLQIYCHLLEGHVENVLKLAEQISWEEDPLFSLFTEGCQDVNKDIADGGATNNDVGILSVGLSNTINSLLLYNDYVFVKEEFVSSQIYEIWNGSRMSEKNELLMMLKNCEKYFGHDNQVVLDCVNKITVTVSDRIAKYQTKYGGRVKFGLSSPGYVMEGKTTEAVFDGRDAEMPLGVHISSSEPIALTELINFSCRLDYYANMSNGNVVDLIIPLYTMNKNLDKYKGLVYNAITNGVYQMQINVVDSQMLIDAKKNPRLYGNLIVRVWGFSAYFNDLSEEYKDILINRSLDAEKVA